MMNASDPLTSFSFVDGITEIELGRRVRGTFTVPATVPTFPTYLVVEAVGQLAAWAAMAAADFSRRPVAALTHLVVLGPDVPSGTTLALAVEIERQAADAVVYSGTATAGDRVVARFDRAVGPMLPMEDFDDPVAMRARFDRLCRQGRDPQDFDGGRGWQLALGPADGEPGEHCTAALSVPADASFFADHFPRKPVLPATLLFGTQARLAIELARKAVPGGETASIQAVEFRGAKVRAFISPGEQLTLSAQIMAARQRAAEVAVSARRGAQPIGSARVQVEFAQ